MADLIFPQPVSEQAIAKIARQTKSFPIFRGSELLDFTKRN